jgi:hypothetical protein
MEAELGYTVDIEEVKTKLKTTFAQLFEYEYADANVSKQPAGK